MADTDLAGPFETEADARASEAVLAARAAYAEHPGVGMMTSHNLAMMLAACQDAGVTPGAYDARILEWVAGFEPEACAVIAGLIRRASGNG